MARIISMSAIVLAALAAALVPHTTSTTLHAASVGAAAKCKYGSKTVTKKVHGKLTKVKVCKKAPRKNPTPTATPTSHLFAAPSGIAVDAGGNIFVADEAADRIVKLDPNGHLLMAFGSKGRDPGQLDEPGAVALDAAGNIYEGEDTGVSQRFLDQSAPRRVQKFSPSGQPLAQIPKAAGQFDVPGDIAVDSAGNVYVTDLGFSQVIVYDPDFHVVRRIATPGAYPAGIALDSQGNLYVTQVEENNIVKVSPTGTLLATYGSSGTGPGQFNGPNKIILDAAGNMYVADVGNNRVQKLSPTGAPLASWGSLGTGAGQFDLTPIPTIVGLAIDAQGNLYVPDPGNSRVQKLSPTGEVLGIFQ